MKRIYLSMLVPFVVWGNSLMIGPGRTYTTIQAGIDANLPLQENLTIYAILPTLSYTTPQSIQPNSSWNGYSVRVEGLRSAPQIVAYGEEGTVFEFSGDRLDVSYEQINIGGSAEGRFKGDVQYAYFKDRLGSTRATVKEDGQVDEAQMYFSYGRIDQLLGSSNVTKEKFTGKEYDTEGASGSESGVNLDYFGARYYDSELGIWISPDPVRQFASPYSYAGNGYNPVTGVDRDGKTLGSNLRFLWQWIIGSGETNRTYDERNLETKELAASQPIKELRQKFYDGGAKSIVNHEYPSWTAYRETAWKVTETEAQIGGFGNGSSLINNGDGTMTFTVYNDAGTHSFWFHAVDDRACEDCAMRTIHQTFKWTEPIQMPGQKR